MKVTLVQTNSKDDKAANLHHAEQLLRDAFEDGRPDLVAPKRPGERRIGAAVVGARGARFGRGGSLFRGCGEGPWARSSGVGMRVPGCEGRDPSAFFNR